MEEHILLPCDRCPKFDRQKGYCQKVDEFLFNGYAQTVLEPKMR
jgi:hypothetical protein